ncbi:MAG: peptide ABC transporter substrate-binding protein [Cyanobacteriota bacterium]|nr:peptide ABC transporter substrate-binding protein [Cyanobacteriota bacterium]
MMGGLSLWTPVQAQSADTLRMLYWQAPTILNPHLSTGTKDFEASRITYEPLASFDRSGTLIPILAAEAPTVENGGISSDYKTVTWKLKPDVKWSDGQPFTADDVVFTYTFITDPESAAVTTSSYEGIASVEAVDPTTVKITFKEPTAAWASPFVGINGQILPKHIFEPFLGAKSREAPANLAPIGTGPFKLVEFKPGDVAVYEANPNFREPGKPYFKRLELKGGGDATSAARAVLQTGDADYAWNVQVEASVLGQMEAAGMGYVYPKPGPDVERIMFQFADPNQEVDGERAHKSTKHPFFSDLKVRQAFNLAMDRDTIANQLYGKAGQATANFLAAPENVASKNTAYEYNLEKAAALLDEAGWKDTNNNKVRDKDGVEMKVLFQTSVNPLRQKTQEIIKQSLGQIGVEVELKSTDASIYFDSEPANNDNTGHFYADLQMFTTGNENPDPGRSYMDLYSCDAIAQKENNWSVNNVSRYCNPEYDKLMNAGLAELDPAKRAAAFIAMNDFLINDVAVMPLVNRASPSAVSNRLQDVLTTPWDLEPWMIKEWKPKA